MVGDTDQAIYSGLGGVAKSKEELESEFGNIKIECRTISGCYRSSQRIIDFYSNFQLNKFSITASGKNKTETGNICFNKNITRQNVYEYIAKIVQANLDKGIPQNEICIIAPRWELVIPCGRHLTSILKDVEFNAPGLSPLGKSHDNIFFKIARLFLTEPSPRMFSTRLRWSHEVIQQLVLNFSICFDESIMTPRMFLRIVNKIQCNDTIGIEYLKNVFEQLFNEIGICMNENQGLLEQYNAFIDRAIQRQDIEGIPKDTEGFRKMFKTRTGIVVNTCHGVKGEEFETVIAFGLLNGYIPNWKDIWSGQSEKVDMSKKLMYVTCSRAKKNLYLIAEEGHLTRKKVAYSVNDELNSVLFDYDEIVFNK